MNATAAANGRKRPHGAPPHVTAAPRAAPLAFGKAATTTPISSTARAATNSAAPNRSAATATVAAVAGGVPLPRGVLAACARHAGGPGKAGRKKKGSAADDAAKREAARALIASLPDDAIVAAADGGCAGNPGPTGSGAVVCLPSADAAANRGRAARLASAPAAHDRACGEWREGWRAMGPRATNNVGELAAVGLALDLALRHVPAYGARPPPAPDADAPLPPQLPALRRAAMGRPRRAELHVLCDSKYAIGCLSYTAVNVSRGLAARVLQKLARATHLGFDVHLHHVFGHVGVPLNERADFLADCGVEMSTHAHPQTAHPTRKRKGLAAGPSLAGGGGPKRGRH